MKVPPGLLAATVICTERCWAADYRQWQQRELSRRGWVYVWANGISGATGG